MDHHDEKKTYEVTSGLPHYNHEVEAIDMRERHGSVAKNEAAELYGDIQTAEGKPD